MLLMPGSYSHSSSFSMVWTVLLLELLHTSLKWLQLLHLLHFVPYARHHLGLWASLQHLHLFLTLVATVVVGLVSLCLPFLCIIVSKFFISCILPITTIWALWASIFFPSLMHVHLVLSYSYHILSAL